MHCSNSQLLEGLLICLFTLCKSSKQEKGSQLLEELFVASVRLSKMSQYVVSGRSKQTIKSWMKKPGSQTAADFLSFCNNYRRAWGCGCDYVKAIGHEF